MNFDKELDEIIKNDLAYYGGSLSPSAIAKLSSLIQRVEIEARLDELRSIKSMIPVYRLDRGTNKLINAMNMGRNQIGYPIEEHINNRIKALKALNEPKEEK